MKKNRHTQLTLIDAQGKTQSFDAFMQKKNGSLPALQGKSLSPENVQNEGLFIGIGILLAKNSKPVHVRQVAIACACMCDMCPDSCSLSLLFFSTLTYTGHMCKKI